MEVHTFMEPFAENGSRVRNLVPRGTASLNKENNMDRELNRTFLPRNFYLILSGTITSFEATVNSNRLLFSPPKTTDVSRMIQISGQSISSLVFEYVFLHENSFPREWKNC